MWNVMSDPFPLVRKGYDPDAVEAFVKQQADAWRTRVDRAQTAATEWKQRATAFEERVMLLEQRLKTAGRESEERIGHLEGELAEARWARDQAQSALAEERANHSAVSAESEGIVERARMEATRILQTAQEETQQWFAAARRRIEMAEAHAAERFGVEAFEPEDF